MALATICPHCNTTFRVAADQLKLRGGIVRCGACNEVFDGNAALVELTAAARPADAAVAAQQAPVQQEPTYKLDFDTTFDPFGILPASPHPAPEPEPAPPATGPATVSIQHADEEILARPVLDDTFEQSAEAPAPAPDPLPAREASVDFQLPLLMRPSATHAPALAPTQASPSVPTPPVDAAAKSVRRNAAKKRKAPPVAAPVVAAAAVAPEPEPSEHEPEFVKTSRRKAQTGRSRRLVLGAGAVLLVLALAAQGVATFRNVLAARHPQAKPLLALACAVIGCKIELPAQIDALSVETGELQLLGANTFSFTTLLRNQANLVQTWPHLELALTDANDKPLVRRVFTPADYLPQGVAPDFGIAPHSEQAVRLAFELSQVKASGYRIAIFYP